MNKTTFVEAISKAIAEKVSDQVEMIISIERRRMVDRLGVALTDGQEQAAREHLTNKITADVIGDSVSKIINQGI